MIGAAILVIYTVVGFTAAGSSGYYQVERRDWRPIGTFVDMAACKEAERLLGQADRTRCLPGAKVTP